MQSPSAAGRRGAGAIAAVRVGLVADFARTDLRKQRQLESFYLVDRVFFFIQLNS